MFNANIGPGHGFAELKLYAKASGLSATGRPTKSSYAFTGDTMYGMIMNASQTEVDQWKQKGHPISHKIIEYNASPKLQPTDLIRQEAEDRNFIVQGTKNPAELGVTMIYYVEERLDLAETLTEGNT